MLYATLDGSKVLGKLDTRIFMAKSLHCSSQTITTLLISYTPIQNVFGVKKRGKKKKHVI